MSERGRAPHERRTRDPRAGVHRVRPEPRRGRVLDPGGLVNDRDPYRAGRRGDDELQLEALVTRADVSEPPDGAFGRVSAAGPFIERTAVHRRADDFARFDEHMEPRRPPARPHTDGQMATAV